MNSYQGKRALVTGGLGFIGSNVALRLVQLGARVTVVDASIQGCGANPRNLHPLAGEIEIIPFDVREGKRFASAIAASDVIFNLAGEISHSRSMSTPQRDLDLNATAQLFFLEECARSREGVRIVYACTRQVYGAPDYLPVDENHPVHPIDFNGVHKFTASSYHLVFGRVGALDPVVLRLSNVYGPRMALELPWQGFLGTFFRRTLVGECIEVFGEGLQLRDPTYVDDVVDAMLLAGTVANLRHRVFNVGGPAALSLNEIAETLRSAADGLEIRHVPFPEQRRKVDIGSYYADWSRIRSELGWTAVTSFAKGAALTLEYYRSQLDHYITGLKHGIAR